MSNPRLNFSYLMCLAIAVVAGCGEPPKGGERLAVFPVSGEIFVDGEPAEGASVLLTPVTPHNLPASAAPIASTGAVDDSGKFVISTYESGDGAPNGKYKLTVTWQPSMGLSKKERPDKLRGRYSDPGKSEIEVDVADGEVSIPRIELKSK